MNPNPAQMAVSTGSSGETLPASLEMDQKPNARIVSFSSNGAETNQRVKMMTNDMRGVSLAKCDAKCHVIARIPTRVELLTLTHLAKRPAINIDFKDIEYSVRNPFSNGTNKTKKILHKISGNFRSGELTAILGSSGAGKTTLINILAGYLTIGVNGIIETNGHPRQLNNFSKLKSYILQEDMLQPFLTVAESMKFATNLKLGHELNDVDKERVVEEVMSTLRLDSARDTRTENLSGGQRKRLSVALELVNNPPVIFLDEPTTGLDTVSTTQLMTLLKLLARQGRTIICTMHQPAATLFETLDLVYVMAAGKCMYQGPHEQLVPYMTQVGLQCPITYNPADYVMEVISPDQRQNQTALCAASQNGKLRLTPEPLNTPATKVTKLCRKETVAVMPKVYSEGAHLNIALDFPTSFMEQTSILLRRRFMQQSRNKTTLAIMLIHHIISGLLIGLTFFGVGNMGHRPFDNIRLIMCSIVFYTYTHLMCNILLFPFELKRIDREYFNRWYGLNSYFTSQTLSNLPAHILLGMLFAVLVYFLTDQPMEPSRLIWFYVINLLIGLASEGIGLTIGAIFKVQNGCVAGPMTLVPMLAVAVYGMGFGTVVEPLMQALMKTSYLRFGMVGLGATVYGGRGKMHCEDPYCHYQEPEQLLRDLGMGGEQPYQQALWLSAFVVFYRITAYLALRFKFSKQCSTKLYTYISKILRLR